MATFWAYSKQGNLNLGSEYNRNRFREDLIKNDGARYKIERFTPESPKQRRFFEGACIPLWVYLNDGDYHDSEINKFYREEAKKEFNGDMVIIDGRPRLMGRSTKGELNKGFIDKFIDHLEEQYAIKREEGLNPEDYKYYRDVLLVSDLTGEIPLNYIDYMIKIGKLKSLKDIHRQTLV